MQLFFGKAGCAKCHGGKFLTDQDFHAIAMPQIGPGKGDVALVQDGLGDIGRGRETLDAVDDYGFRTPTLRNTAVTGPWGHSGAYNTLEAVVRHHLDPVASLHAYDISQAVLPAAGAAINGIDFVLHQSIPDRELIASANTLAPIALSEAEIVAIIDFLHALTDPSALDMRATVPSAVPSGLPVFD
jgi:cytochrome c peroxidase